MTSYNAPSGVHEIRGISGLDRPERSEDRTRRVRIPVILFKKVIRLDDLV